MNNLLGWMMVLVTLPVSAFQSQNVTGDWQGVLQIGQQKMRIVFKIALEKDNLRATLRTVDQPSQPIAATITRDGTTVKIKIPAQNGNFEGKLSADGNSIAGTWAQAAPMPLTLARATKETAWAIPEPPPPPVKMAANVNPSFEVATIKPSDPAKPGQVITLKGTDVVTTNTTLHDLIILAYWVHPKELAGGPAWMDSDKYDLVGRPDAPGQPSVDQMKTMIQKLLTDRFQLKFHVEKRDLAVYAVTTAKTGTKLVKSEADPNGLPGWSVGRNAKGAILTFRNSPLSQVTAVLQNWTDKPVVDQSGLTGRYDFTVVFTPDALQAGRMGVPLPAVENPEAAPDLATAFQQQLGLRLESTKAPTDVMVLDKVERPSEN